VHQVLNPLTYLVLELERLRGLVAASQDERLRRDVDRGIARALEGAERIKAVVHDVSAFGRADGEHTRTVDVAAPARLALQLVRHRIEARARVSWSEDAAPPVAATEGCLAQVFLGLLVHALEAIPAGDPQSHDVGIAIGTDPDGWAFVDVSDTGPPVPSDAISRIFEPFFAGSGRPDATGLTLALCKDTVESVGGEIAVLRGGDRGVRFRVRLPPAPSGTV
jgi:signal transduction histidine kinase